MSSSVNPAGCGCGSARQQQQQPRAPLSSCEQALESERKESRPAPNFTSLPALTAGTKRGMGTNTEICNMEKS
ncbi:hypothetical protein PBY51_014704 [Eleginops maclovinus]|uniref:Uncharacterized protein n=1 Tax=Eleginops maclovinus TaxID=56733 RepID=A0AAN7X1P8_ELEMC|nr:hypothetical protein PBY51_014704 [Eleginops maclovinus]